MEVLYSEYGWMDTNIIEEIAGYGLGCIYKNYRLSSSDRYFKYYPVIDVSEKEYNDWLDVIKKIDYYQTLFYERAFLNK